MFQQFASTVANNAWAVDRFKLGSHLSSPISISQILVKLGSSSHNFLGLHSVTDFIEESCLEGESLGNLLASFTINFSLSRLDFNDRVKSIFISLSLGLGNGKVPQGFESPLVSLPISLDIKVLDFDVAFDHLVFVVLIRILDFRENF